MVSALRTEKRDLPPDETYDYLDGPKAGVSDLVHVTCAHSTTTETKAVSTTSQTCAYEHRLIGAQPAERLRTRIVC